MSHERQYISSSLGKWCPPRSGWRWDLWKDGGPQRPAGKFWKWDSPYLPLSLSVTSLGKYLPSVSISKASQLCETLVSGHAYKQGGFKSAEQLSAWLLSKDWAGCSALLNNTSASTQKQPKSSLLLSALLGKERIHLGLICRARFSFELGGGCTSSPLHITRNMHRVQQ